MGTVVEKSALRTILLELLIKDSSLALDIFQTIVKEDPLFLEKVSLNNQVVPEVLTPTSTPMLVNEPSVVYKATEKNSQKSESEGISDEELDFWVDKHFTEYEAVFKALA